MHYLERTCEIQIAAQAVRARRYCRRSRSSIAHGLDRPVEPATWNGPGSASRRLLRRLDREDPSYRR